MKIAFFMTVCEGEYDIAQDALESLIQSCRGIDISLFVVDDASPSRVGWRLANRFRELTSQPSDCFELPKSLGFRGMIQRKFLGLERIANSKTFFDIVLKLDPDALVTRYDLGEFLTKQCSDGLGFYGELYGMRKRDALLYCADLLPFGFRRRQVDGVIQHQWELSRVSPVWWTDIGWKAIANGFHFTFIPGCFWFMGGKTLKSLHEAGYLARNQSSYGFVFNDDLILTTSVYAIKHPVKDLNLISPHWRKAMAMSEGTPLSIIEQLMPYVIHPLKNNPDAWERRQQLKVLREHWFSNTH